MLKIILLVLSAEVCAAIGHTLFKKSTNTVGTRSLRGIDGHVSFLLNILAKPSIWAGILFMAMGLAIWLVALAKGDLSFVYPIGSIQYILTLFSSRVFLKEKIDRMKLIGTLLVVLGIILVAAS